MTKRPKLDPMTRKTILLATGSSAKWLGLPSEQKLIGKGVSSCAVCDAAFFRDKKIALVGGGDAAMKEALFLTKFALEVNVIHRRDKLRAFQALQDRAFSNPKIKFIWNSVIEEVLDRDIRPYIALDGGGVELLNLLQDKEVIIAYQGTCTSCFASAGTTLSYIQQVLRAHVHPELDVVPNL